MQLINPKAYVVHTTLFSGFGFFGSNIVMETVLKLLIMNLIWIPLHLAWLWAGVSLRRMDLSARTQSRVNFAMALSMLVVVGLALISQV